MQQEVGAGAGVVPVTREAADAVRGSVHGLQQRTPESKLVQILRHAAPARCPCPPPENGGKATFWLTSAVAAKQAHGCPEPFNDIT